MMKTKIYRGGGINTDENTEAGNEGISNENPSNNSMSEPVAENTESPENGVQENRPVGVADEGILPQQQTETKYLYFGEDGQQLGEASDDTSNPPEGWVGYVERKVDGTNVTVTPHAADGYEFAMLNLISKGADFQNNENAIYTPLSRDYVKNGSDNKQIAEGEQIAYTFQVGEEQSYEIGAAYTEMPDLAVYFDKKDGKLNESILALTSKYEGSSDQDKEKIQKWLSGKILAGAASPWSGLDVSNNSSVIYDAGEKRAFEIRDVVLYGRFGWQERFRFSIELSNDGVSYQDVLKQTGNTGKDPYTLRADLGTESKHTGRYLKLKGWTPNTDVAYLALYGQIVSSCEKLSGLNNLLEEYKSVYNNGTNSANYKEELWNAFKEKYQAAKEKAGGHGASASCSDNEDNQLEQAKAALQTAYQNLIESKTSVTYQFFKEGNLIQETDSLDGIQAGSYDGYVKVAVSEDGTGALLTPVAAEGHEFSLLTLEALDANGKLLRSFSPISQGYRKKLSTEEDTERITDNNYQVKLTLGTQDGGKASLQFAQMPGIQAYFDTQERLVDTQIYATKQETGSVRPLKATLIGCIHAGGDKWANMFEQSQYNNSKAGIDFKKGDQAVFYAGQGSQFSIDSVIIYGRSKWANTRYEGLVVEASNDGTTYNELFKTTNRSADRQWETPRDVYEKPIYARYLRLSSTKDNLNISKIKFYGAIETDKIDYYSLKQACDEAKDKKDAGQTVSGQWDYTDESWNAFVTAYNEAAALLAQWENNGQQNPTSKDTIAAAEKLIKAMQNLAEGLPTFINQNEGQLKHPAVGNSAEDLQRLRAHVLANEEPWASYYKEFSESEYASKDYKIRNDANPESDTLTPKKGYADYQTNLFNGDMVYDAKAAYYQAVMYYMTGDAAYRERQCALCGSGPA